jgi:hypothetical protein
MKYFPASLLILAVAGCTAAGSTDSIANALVDDTPDAVGVLALVNDPATSEEILDDDVPLDARAARNLVAGRPFASIDEIDAVAYVGPVAMENLAAYAAARGYTPSGSDLLGVYDGVSFTVDEAELALDLVNEVSDGVLRVEVGLDSRAVSSILEARPVPSVRALSELYWVGSAMLERIKAFTAAPDAYERADCRGDSDCDEGWRCGGIPNDGSSDLGLCYPTASIPGEGNECDADDDCGEGLACNGITVGYGLCLPWWMHDSFENTTQRFIGETTDPVVTGVVVRGQASVPMDVIVTADILHSKPHALRVALIDPNGAEAVLWDGPNTSGPMPSTFNAQGEISRDDEVDGQWLLRIVNEGGAGTGNLYSWTLDVSSRFD